MQANGNSQESDGDTDDSSSITSVTSLTFYPAYCFKASPTWFTWVKLTAHDIHTELQERPKYHKSSTGTPEALLLFFQNHPIQFVQLVGVIVNVENYYEKYWLFTIDDSSGATIDVTCRKPLLLPASKGSDQNDGADGEKSRKQDPDERDRIDAMSRLDNGVVVQVKGQISTFRHVRQILLERITIIPDTNQEMRLIAARTAFFKNVLSRPWMISESTRKQLWKSAIDDEEAAKSHLLRLRRKEEEKKNREKRHEVRIQKKYQRDEARRAAAAQAARTAGQLLL